MDAWHARLGVSPHRQLLLWGIGVAVVAGLVACGGGGNDSSSSGPPASPVSAAGEPQAGELPGSVVLAEPRAVRARAQDDATALNLTPKPRFTSRLALAWAPNGQFTGNIVAQTEALVAFEPRDVFELQPNGPAATFSAGRFDLRYADGYFLFTALSDIDDSVPVHGLAMDVYPAGVERVPPTFPPCDGGDAAPCYNGFDYVLPGDWPRVAGRTLSVLVPRQDPTGLAHVVLVKPSEREDFGSVATVAGFLSAELDRGTAWRLDFPTARVKVRSCNAAGECLESNERPLQGALTQGVVALTPQAEHQGGGRNAHVAMSADGNLLVSKYLGTDVDLQMVVYARDSGGEWSPQHAMRAAGLGHSRTFALSGDGNTLAVEIAACEPDSADCNTSVLVFVRNPSTFEWTFHFRMNTFHSPVLNHDGSRMAVERMRRAKGNPVAVFKRDGSAWSQTPFPPLDYVPLDMAFSADGRTLAVARRGTNQDPCGCRAVVIYDCSDPLGWHQTAVLHSSKPWDGASAADDDGFGSVASPSSSGVALSGDGSVLAVGASLDSSDATDTVGDPANRAAPHSGAVYLFARRADGTWRKEAFLKARGATAQGQFGRQVALARDGSVLFGGARGLEANAAGINRNHAADTVLPTAAPRPDGVLGGAAAYGFERDSNGTWVQRAALAAPNARAVDFDRYFALAISASAGTVALGTGEIPEFGLGVARTVFVY